MNNIFVTIGKGSTLDTFMPPHIKTRLAALGNVRYADGHLNQELLADNLEDVISA